MDQTAAHRGNRVPRSHARRADDPEARRAASDALAAIGRPAVAPLAKLADSQDEWIREGSRRTLSSIDDPDARQARATWLP